MPAIDGMSLFRSRWLPLRIAPPAARNSSGSRKLKKAALGLRQNMRRSRRYWRQPSTMASGIGRQLHVDVLERGAPHRQLLQALAPLQRLGGELVQERRRIVGHALEQLAFGAAIGDAGARRSHAPLLRRDRK